MAVAASGNHYIEVGRRRWRGRGRAVGIIEGIVLIAVWIVARLRRLSVFAERIRVAHTISAIDYEFINNTKIVLPSFKLTPSFPPICPKTWWLS